MIGLSPFFGFQALSFGFKTGEPSSKKKAVSNGTAAPSVSTSLTQVSTSMRDDVRLIMPMAMPPTPVTMTARQRPNQRGRVRALKESKGKSKCAPATPRAWVRCWGSGGGIHIRFGGWGDPHWVWSGRPICLGLVCCIGLVGGGAAVGLWNGVGVWLDARATAH
eukprot:5393135-Prymnesium_polylepis.2